MAMCQSLPLQLKVRSLSINHNFNHPQFLNIRLLGDQHEKEVGTCFGRGAFVSGM